MSTIAGAIFKMTNKKLHVPIVFLSTKDNVKLSKQLNKGLKRSVYWNAYITKLETNKLDNKNHTRFSLDASFQGFKRLFVLAFKNANNGNK